MFSIRVSTWHTPARSTKEVSRALSKLGAVPPKKCFVPYSVLAPLGRCSNGSGPKRTRAHQPEYKILSVSRHLPETTTSLKRHSRATLAIRAFSTARHRKSTNSATQSSSPGPIMSLIIRPVAQSDKDVWLTLWEGYNTFYKRTIPTEVTDTTFSRFLDDSVRMYCAVAEDPDTKKIIGFITWYPHISTSSIKEIIYIHDLFVDPTVRNKGTGRKLIEHVYAEAEKLPASQVYWHTQYFNYVGQLLYTKVADRTDFIKYAKMM